MIAHQITNILMMMILLADSSAFDSIGQKIIEVCSELFMHLTSIMLA